MAEDSVLADRNRIEQVIINLINNAIKYAPDSDIIHVNLKKEQGYVKVEVQDFGIGIPNDKKDLIFNRFYRVEETSRKFNGLGLGLYISAEIIQRHNGEIGFES